MIRVSVAYAWKSWVPDFARAWLRSLLFTQVSRDTGHRLHVRSTAYPDGPEHITKEEFDEQVAKTVKWAEKQ